MNKRLESLKVLREMNDEELAQHLRAQRRKLFEVRFQQATRQVENHRQVRELRREIARTMSVQIEFERGLTPAPRPELQRPAAPAKPAEAEAAEPIEAVEDEEPEAELPEAADEVDEVDEDE